MIFLNDTKRYVLVIETHYVICQTVKDFYHTSIPNKEGSVLLKSPLFVCTDKRAPFQILKQMNDFHKLLCEHSQLLVM